MSAAKHGLPTSLTPDVLKEALGYEPRHWKVLKARLARKRPAIWGDMKLSDNDFYVELHRNLQDPNQPTGVRSCGKTGPETPSTA